MKIIHLPDLQKHLNTVVNWINDEFVIKEGRESKKDQIKEFFGHKNYNSFPITYIAVQGENCLGTISIFENDLETRKDLKPWLASFFVSEEHRRKGIGEKLVSKLLEKVKEMGYDSIYLRTEHTSEYYKKRNWKFISQEIDKDGQETEVYRYNLLDY
jgi:predicted N-acetyltransferase YhbS